jgi:arylsulfatase A-like enzyme
VTAKAIARLLLILLVACVGGLALWRARPGAASVRLVVLYAPCTVNKQFLEPYRHEVAYTPSLAAFGRTARIFTRHQTEASQSGIAYAALLTGTDATRHGVFFHPTRLPDDAYLVSEAFRDDGWDTAFWADHVMATPELNYAQGVTHVYWRPKPLSEQNRGKDALRGDDPRFQAILARLRSDRTYKAFILTAFTVTHSLYDDTHVPDFCHAYPAECTLGPAAWERSRGLFQQNALDWSFAFDDTSARLHLAPSEVTDVVTAGELLYKSNIHHLDRLFGGVVDQIRQYGLLSESIVVFTADHGEVMYRDNSPVKWTHGFTLAPEELGVPLLVQAPGVAPGRYEAVTRVVDVFPTLAGLAGVRVPTPRWTGIDLSRALRGAAPPPELLAFSHTSALGFKPPADPDKIAVAVRDADRVYKIANRDGGGFEPEVYDIGRDPEERRNLYDPADEAQRQMLARLTDYRADLVRAFERLGIPGHQPTEHEQQLLRSLGYIN